MPAKPAVLLILFLVPALAAATLAATPDELLQTVRRDLAATDCDCGCGMTVLECLHDDPSCDRSPQIARQVLAEKLSSAAAESALEVVLELRETDCPCGCEMTVLECLDEDPSCSTSPEIAKKILAQLTSTPEERSPSVSPRRPSGQARCGDWCEIKGKLIVHISSGGGYRKKECVWLYADATYDINNQSGSVTSLGNHAAQGGGGGTWSVEGDVLVMQGEGGGRFPLSYSDGAFYLGNWRYFIVDLNDPTCQ